MLVYLLVLGLITNFSTACIDCSIVEGDRGKLSPISDDEYLKIIAMANRATVGETGQQKALLYRKLMGLPHQHQPRSSISLQSSAQLPSNLHVYTLLNKGSPFSASEPKLFVDDYTLQDSIPKMTKKAEKGMLVDVMDYVSKSDDRNRRVGQNMRSSG